MKASPSRSPPSLWLGQQAMRHRRPSIRVAGLDKLGGGGPLASPLRANVELDHVGSLLGERRNLVAGTAQARGLLAFAVKVPPAGAGLEPEDYVRQGGALDADGGDAARRQRPLHRHRRRRRRRARQAVEPLGRVPLHPREQAGRDFRRAVGRLAVRRARLLDVGREGAQGDGKGRRTHRSRNRDDVHGQRRAAPRRLFR